MGGWDEAGSSLPAWATCRSSACAVSSGGPRLWRDERDRLSQPNSSAMNRSSRRTGEGGFHLVKCGRLFVLALMATAIVAAMAAEVSATTTRAEARLPEAGSSTCPSGSKRAVIAGKPRCLRTGQPCAKRNEAAYKKHGFTCVNGHLRKRTVAPAPSPTPPPASLPPPPPASPAQPGHYKGTTSQLEIIEFDVTADGIHVAALFNMIVRLADSLGWDVPPFEEFYARADGMLASGYALE